MNALSSHDIDRLICAVSDLQSDRGSRPVSVRVLEAVDSVIPNDLVAMDTFADDHVDDPGIHWNTNDEMLTPEIAEVCSAVFETHPHDNPLVVEQVFRGNRDVLMLEDFCTGREFRETVYFNEILRRLQLDRQMAVMLPAGSGLSFSCAINRKGRQFDERDRQMLALLAPHLAGALALENERSHRLDSERRLSAALDAVFCGVIVLSSTGKLVQITAMARQLVEAYFPQSPIADNGLPVDLMEWSRTSFASLNAVPLPSEPLCLSQNGNDLRITAEHDPDAGETTLRLEEKRTLSPAVLASLGLTKRESEVLFWIAKGKTDPVIAELLGAGRRTIEKHAENIFRKLGVETRTAAAAAAMEVMMLSGSDHV